MRKVRVLQGIGMAALGSQIIVNCFNHSLACVRDGLDIGRGAVEMGDNEHQGSASGMLAVVRAAHPVFRFTGALNPGIGMAG
ncbi:MAG: hypothetical protein RLZZ303_1904 [Candidatus Hydrogenedentota bacterium]